MLKQDPCRNVLAGILALQLDFISPDTLVRTLRQWSAEKSQGVDDLLVANGMLTPIRRDLLAALVDERLRHHEDDSAKCLAALSVTESLRDDLLLIADPELTETLTRMAHSRDGSFSLQTVTGDHETRTVVGPPPAAGTGAVSSPTAPATMGTGGVTAGEGKPHDPYATFVHGSEVDPTATRPVSVPSGTKPNPTEAQLPITAIAQGAVSRLEARTQTADRYRVLRLHAKGGLGMVSVAEDAELHREVALKEIQYQHADNSLSRARFLVEAEVTGKLEHPGIVPVYGLGRYADGRPYYAMRFIRGQSLRRAIEEQFKAAKNAAGKGSPSTLELRGLLGRFIAVCDTMAYAHNRGILHRDLKPDNIMLGEYGETLVVDWGLAKVMGRPDESKAAGEDTIVLSSGTESGTMSGSAVGTPQFMSPEQAQGRHDELTVASDIYSLGATLYQVLTGVPPFDPTKLHEMLRRVKEGKFPPPRARLKTVPPALDAICMKAMALYPENRYDSARSLAADLEHWLADEPVAVYQESGSQKLARWGRRHRAAVQATVAALGMIALVAIVSALVVNQSRHREATAKTEATQRSRQAREAVDALLTGFGQELENYPGMQEARKRLLQKSVADYEKLTQVGNSDPELRAEAARAFVRLGDVHTLLNQTAKADAAYDAAIERWQELCTDAPSRTDFRVELANAFTRRGIGAATTGRNERAEQAYNESLAVLEPIRLSEPNDRAAADALGTVLVNLGQLQSDQARREQAEGSMRRAVETLESIEQTAGSMPRTLYALSLARTMFGRLLVSLGREHDAIQLFRDSIASESRLIEADPDDARYRSAQASCRVDLAAALRDAGRFEEEVAAYRQAVDDYVVLVSQFADVPKYRQNVALTRTNLGQALNKLGQNPEARAELRTAAPILDDLAAEFPAVPDYLEELAATYATLAGVSRELGKTEEAKSSGEKSLVHYRQLIEALPDVVRYRAGLGVALARQARVLMSLDENTAAEAALGDAFAELKQAISGAPHDPHYRENLAAAQVQLGWLKRKLDDSPGTRAAQQEALDVLAALQKEFPDATRVADSMAWLLTTGPASEFQDLARAEKLSSETVRLEPLNDFYWRTLGTIQYRQAKFADARDSLKKAYDLRPTEQGIAVFLLAMAEWKLNHQDDARSLYREAVTWSDKNKPNDDELLRFRSEAKSLIEPAE